LGKPPKDYDVATDATPEAVRGVFGKRRTIAFGASFGVIGVLPPTDRSQPERDGLDQESSFSTSQESGQRQGRARRASVEPTEVATFRSDGHYSDGRRPDSVHYGDARNDALRRDFTINGLFYDPQEEQVIDYVGGQSDLAAGILQTIGDPLLRFGEDRLRMLRAIRFATTLEFEIHPTTLDALQQHADDISVVSGERIGAEMRRVLVSVRAFEGLRYLVTSGIHRVVLPEIVDLDWDRLNRLLVQTDPRSFPLALACIGVAIPDSHEGLLAIDRRWRLSSEELRQASTAVQNWEVLIRASALPWSAVQPKLVLRDTSFIVALAEAVAAADGISTDGLELAKRALEWPAEQLDPAPLLTGSDLKELGFQPGPQFSKLLTSLRESQLDGELTTREQAVEWLRHSES
jgi:tRNA nucleotidyltransferase (CCA-adding enzyme)|tara:strand:- start:413 stop:1627 length:1215 start_codon:yes stop_codon:yes gene_type:complete